MMTRRNFFGLSVLVPGAAVMPSKVEIPEDVRMAEVRPDRAYVFLVNRYSQVDAEALAKTIASLGVRGAVVLSDGQDSDVRFMEMEVPTARTDDEFDAVLSRYCNGDRHVFRSRKAPSCQCGKITEPFTS